MSAGFGASILVLSPHLDDEVVGCCAAIGRARAAGAAVQVLHLTHGCVPRRSAWPWARGAAYDAAVAIRRAEAEAAALALDVIARGWSQRPARGLWRDLPAAEAEVRAALAAQPADQIWVPAFEGGNPDHDGANAIASRFAAEGLSVLEFAEYNLAGGKPRSHEFPTTTGAEVTLTLTDAERAFKRAALDIYASERGNLGYVGVDREVYRPLPAHDYAAPPHPGQLWWARFQWSPLRHPMIDFTAPAEVSAALAAYVGADRVAAAKL
ncbi:MAG TPA: PIG-L family deacetylase [Caulobacteraceae bacterium]